jgi:hypothetical protein
VSCLMIWGGQPEQVKSEPDSMKAPSAEIETSNITQSRCTVIV